MTRVNYSVSEPFNLNNKIDELNEKIGASSHIDKKKKEHNKKMNRIYDTLYEPHQHSLREWYFLEDSQGADTKIGIAKDFDSRKAQHIRDQQHKQI